jgi:hypothetical protein
LSRPEITLDHLIIRVRRRMRLKLQLARLARCLAVACAAAVAASAILLCLHRPTVLAPAALIIAGFIAGAAWAAAARVTLLSAAKWTDAKLGLKDLLATACSLRESKTPGNPWRVALLNIAHEKCRNIAPADLPLALGGERTWSAIALSAALAITLGLISLGPHDATIPAAIASATPRQSQSADQVSPVASPPDVPQFRPAADSALNEDSQRPTDGVPSASGTNTGSASGDQANDQTNGTDSAVAAGLSRTSVHIAPENQTALGRGTPLPNAPAAGGGSGVSPGTTPGSSGTLAGEICN